MRVIITEWPETVVFSGNKTSIGIDVSDRPNEPTIIARVWSVHNGKFVQGVCRKCGSLDYGSQSVASATIVEYCRMCGKEAKIEQE